MVASTASSGATAAAPSSTPDPLSLPADRRAALLAAKLRALVAERWHPSGPLIEGAFPSGATAFDPASGRAFVLAEEDVARRLGAALAVARRAEATELHLLVDGAADAAVLARRARQFAHPATVWRVDGRTLTVAEPAPPALDAAPSPEAELYRPVLVSAGLEPVVEGGNLIGELHGLEVARVVVDPDRSAHIEAGVGRFDRDMGAMMFAHLGETDSLARVVEIVGRSRVADADRHPLNHLVPERWLRAALVETPGSVGAAELRAVGSALPRRNLSEAGVATAVGTDSAGRPLVVTCSTGVYLDLIPSAADDRLTHAPDARLVVVVPARDAVPITRELAAGLTHPAEVVEVQGDWRLPGDLV